MCCRIKLVFDFLKVTTKYFPIANIKIWILIDPSLDCKVKDIEKLILKRFDIRHHCRINLILENAVLMRRENASIFHDNDNVCVEVLPRREHEPVGQQNLLTILSKIQAAVEDKTPECWWDNDSPNFSNVEHTPVCETKKSKKRKLVQEHTENIDAPTSQSRRSISSKRKGSTQSMESEFPPSLNQNMIQGGNSSTSMLNVSSGNHKIMSEDQLDSAHVLTSKVSGDHTSNDAALFKRPIDPIKEGNTNIEQSVAMDSSASENVGGTERTKRKRNRGNRGRARKNKLNKSKTDDDKSRQTTPIAKPLVDTSTPKIIPSPQRANKNHFRFGEEETEDPVKSSQYEVCAEEPMQNGGVAQTDNSAIQNALQSLQRKKSYLEKYRSVANGDQNQTMFNDNQTTAHNKDAHHEPSIPTTSEACHQQSRNRDNYQVDTEQTFYSNHQPIGRDDMASEQGEGPLNDIGELQCKTLSIKGKNKNSALFIGAKVFSRQRRTPKMESEIQPTASNVQVSPATPIVPKTEPLTSVPKQAVQLSPSNADDLLPPKESTGVAPKQTKTVPKKCYDGCPPLHGAPRNGDVIAYKVLEMSSDYTPEVSEYKEAKVLSYDPVLKQVTLEHTAVEKVEMKEGRFEVNIEDEETILKSRDDPELVVTLSLPSLLDARLVPSN